MPAQLPLDLFDQVTTFDIDPKRTTRLARSYYRSVAGLVWAQLPSLRPPPDASGRGPVIRWLHPRTVFAAQTIGTSLDPGAFLRQLSRHPELTDPSLPVPAIEHVTGQTAETWCEASIDKIAAERAGVGALQPIRLAAGLPAGGRETLEEARAVLDRVWPAASAEFGLLIRCMVYIEGYEFGSATMPETFGAVYADLGELISVTSALEMILHETAHHSLCLRNAFEKFVLNGSQEVSHPLREDPRPIFGTLHAAQVLARITTGLNRWCREPEAPEEARQDLVEMTAKLDATLGTLRENTQWTPAGARFFGSLERCLQDLADPFPVREAHSR
jgi:HEXXH motif-containing protein